MAAGLRKRRTGHAAAYRVTMKDLAAQISEPLRRPVIEETGLKGRYEIRIDVSAYMQAPAGVGEGHREREIDVMSVLFPALQQQLGVKRRPGTDYFATPATSKWLSDCEYCAIPL